MYLGVFNLVSRFVSSIYFKIILGAALLFLLYNESFVNKNKDLDVFVSASKYISEGKSCYEVWFKSGTAGLKYFYSPLFAVVLTPLAHLPQGVCNLIWLLLNLLVIVRIIKLLPKFLDLESLSEVKKQWFYFLLFVCCIRFAFDCFSLGQMTFLLVWGTLEAFYRFSNKQDVAGGAILALIINIKIIPIALLGYLFYKGYARALIFTVIFSVVFLYLPLLVVGFEFNQQLLKDWYSSLTSTTANSIMDDYGRQSLSSLVPAILMDTPVQFGIKRNFVNLETSSVSLILNIIRLLIVILLAVLFGKPFKKEADRKELFYNLSLICAVTPLFFPHQGKYSFVYLLPAHALIIYFLIRMKGVTAFRKKYVINLILLCFSFILLTLTTDGIIGRAASDWCEYMLLISIGAICIFFLLIRFKKLLSNNFV